MKFLYSIIFSCLPLTSLRAMDVSKETTPSFKDSIQAPLYALLISNYRWDRVNALQEICGSGEAIFKKIKFIEVEQNTQNLCYRGNMSKNVVNQNNEEFSEGLFVFDDAPILDATKKTYLPGPRLILGRTTIPSAEEYAQMKR